MATVLEINHQCLLVIEPVNYNTSFKTTINEKIQSLQIPYDTIVFVKKIPRDPRHHSKIDYDKIKNQILVRKGILGHL
jgi:olefin beta-lactone synthetase